MARAALFAVLVLFALVILPRWLAAPETALPALHGRDEAGMITYQAVPVSDVLADIEEITGFRAVATPQVGMVRFTGSLQKDPDGSRMAATLAGKLDLALRLAGPHWVLTDASQQP